MVQGAIPSEMEMEVLPGSNLLPHARLVLLHWGIQIHWLGFAIMSFAQQPGAQRHMETFYGFTRQQLGLLP